MDVSMPTLVIFYSSTVSFHTLSKFRLSSSKTKDCHRRIWKGEIGKEIGI